MHGARTMLKSLVLTLSLVSAFTTYAMPKFYRDYAESQGIDADKLYALALSQAGITNEFGYHVPWPWSVQLKDQFYQFKTRQDLFNYLKLKQEQGKKNITYGLAGRPLIHQMNSQQLWDSLSVDNNLAYLSQIIRSINCKQLSNCVAGYRQRVKQLAKQTNLLKTSIAPRVFKGGVPATNNFINQIVQRVSKETGVESALIHAVIARESAYKIKATSHAGAMGLMQLMPATAKKLGLKPHEYYLPYKNVLAGTQYLKQQLEEFNNLDLALAAYNAGPGAVRKYRGIPPYKETRQYVPAVKGYYLHFKKGGANG